jgi:hypothetical protein
VNATNACWIASAFRRIIIPIAGDFIKNAVLELSSAHFVESLVFPCRLEYASNQKILQIQAKKLSRNSSVIGGRQESSNLAQEMKEKCAAPTDIHLPVTNRVQAGGGVVMQEKTVKLSMSNATAVIAATTTFVNHATKRNIRLFLHCDFEWTSVTCYFLHIM